jgi:hypothetical protein
MTCFLSILAIAVLTMPAFAQDLDRVYSVDCFPSQKKFDTEQTARLTGTLLYMDKIEDRGNDKSHSNHVRLQIEYLQLYKKGQKAGTYINQEMGGVGWEHSSDRITYWGIEGEIGYKPEYTSADLDKLDNFMSIRIANEYDSLISDWNAWVGFRRKDPSYLMNCYIRRK